MTLAELRNRLKELAEKMESILEAGDTLTDEQAAAFDAAEAELKTVEAEITKLETGEARRATVAAAQARVAAPQPSVAQAALTVPNGGRAIEPQRVPSPEAAREFASHSEAWLAYFQHLKTRGKITDPRLQSLYGEGSDLGGFALPGLRGENTMGVGAEGGFAVPTQFRPDLYELPVAEPIVRSRAMVIPAGDPPDSEIAMPALDQSSNIHGGVTVQWLGEGATQTETDANIRPIVLKPHEVGAFITVTDKLLRNWGAAAMLLPRLLRSAITSEEDFQFIQGDGVAKPLGFVGHASAIAVARNTGSDIKYEDLVKMEAELSNEAMPTWYTKRRTAERLRLLESPEGHLIWGDGSALQGRPPSLLGWPVVYAPRFPALGTRGDLVLADLRNYAIKDGSGPFVASSEHVNFTSNKTLIRVVWNVDGQPLLNAPITDEDGLTYSPFVEIAA